MPQFLRSTLLVLVGGFVMWAVVGCDDKPAAQSSPQPAAATADTLPANLIVAAAPDGALDVAAVRKDAAEGAEVVVRGRIAGRVEPFTEGRAEFQLVDLSVKSCKEIEGDSCPTPWDLCCSESSEIAANSLTVQVNGPDGRPLKAGLQGVSGLAPLSEVSVRGKLQKSADGKAVTVNATELYVKKG